MSDYAHRPGGSLKFKGDDGKKKKKKKSHSSSERSAIDPAVKSSKKVRDTQDEATGLQDFAEKRQVADHLERAERAGQRDDDDDDDYEESRRRKEAELEKALAAQGKGGRKMTEAERRFEEKRRQRREERVAKSATQTHKDRVKDFNDKLDRLTDHNDIPKISWTG